MINGNVHVLVREYTLYIMCTSYLEAGKVIICANTVRSMMEAQTVLPKFNQRCLGYSEFFSIELANSGFPFCQQQIIYPSIPMSFEYIYAYITN